jgi:rhodanese-related sulfurtransferase
VAQKLMDQGFTNIGALLGGLAAWQQAGLPIETSTP